MSRASCSAAGACEGRAVPHASHITCRARLTSVHTLHAHSLPLWSVDRAPPCCRSLCLLPL
jgi:hypothetical protein